MIHQDIINFSGSS